MKKFTVTSMVHIRLEVEAIDEDDAIDKAGIQISQILEQHPFDYEFDFNPLVESTDEE